jgi:choline dehydrogenase-like flavoprotein
MMEADVLIAGSGPAGTSAAWPLVRAGLSVLMVDADNQPLPQSPLARIAEWRFSPSRWRDILGEDLGALAISGDFSPKFFTPLGRAVIGAGIASLPPVRAHNLIVSRSATPGGLSSIWGAFCAAFDASDMVGFLIGPAELASAYSAVAERIGINGADDDLGSFHGTHALLPPLPLADAARRLLNRYQVAGAIPDFRLGRSRNAVLTLDRELRKGCIQCGMCLLGCAHGSIYDSRQDIIELRKFPNFRYQSGAPVRRLVSLGDNGQTVALAIEGKPVIARAKVLFLATGAINSAALALDYFKLFDVKTRLLNNPVAGMAFITPGLVGKDFPESTFGLGQLSYRLSLPNNDYAMGLIYGADTIPLDIFARRMPFSRPAALRLSAALMPAMLLATCYLPGAYSANSFSLRRLDGNSAEVVLTGGMSPEVKRLFRYAWQKLGRIFGRLGAYPVPLSLTISPPGSDAHLAGTIPMAGTGPLSCSASCELKDAQGVFVVDGAWLPHLPAKHLTFTLMANAHRVGVLVADKLRR